MDVENPIAKRCTHGGISISIEGQICFNNNRFIRENIKGFTHQIKMTIGTQQGIWIETPWKLKICEARPSGPEFQPALLFENRQSHGFVDSDTGDDNPC